MNLSEPQLTAPHLLLNTGKTTKQRQAKGRYEHLFFDLDHTLWDFETNSRLTLFQLYDDFNLAGLQLFTAEELYRKYRWVNRRLWTLFNTGKLTMNELRTLRFEQTFIKLGLKRTAHPDGFSEAFTEQAPKRTAVLPYTHQLLAHIHNRYKLHILTNGHPDSQHIKLQSAGIGHYFTEVVTSSCSGFAKPDKRIFSFALSKANAQAKESLMVGDNLQADVLGAKLAGLDQAYYNPAGYAHREKITYEIKCLSELISIL
jgi:putative hydrolase of the HAD superfamily